MSNSPSTGLTPPPDPSVASAVPDVGKSWKERILGGTDLNGSATPLSQAMAQDHQNRLAIARRHYSTMKTAATELGMGDIDPQTGKPTGMTVDPQTGERRAMTPQERAQRTQDYEGSMADYEKAAGIHKDARAQLEQHRGIFDLLVNKGHEALQAVVGAHQQATGQGGGSGGAPQPGQPQATPTSQTPSALPPPPAPTAQGGGASATTPAASAAPATGGAPAAIPPPPSPTPAPASGPTPGDNFRMMAPDIHQRMVENQQIALGGRAEEAKKLADLSASQAGFEQRNKQADTLGLEQGSLERQQFVGEGKFPLIRKPTAMSKGVTGSELTPRGITLVDGTQLDPKKMYDVFQNTDGTQYAMPSGISSTSMAARVAGTAGSSLLAVMHRSNAGDPEAKKDLASYIAMQKDIAKARGEAFGASRAMYQIGAYVDPETQQVIALPAYDAAQRIRAGENLVPSGRLPASMIAGAQRLVKEATPAIKEVRDNLGAYDNAGDRAIFARVMTAAGNPAYGDESSWFGNVIDQAGKEKLSPEGQKLIVRLARLNETIGTLRSTLGAPATDRSMALMLGLLPGPSTPSSKMAGDMIDQLEQNVTNAVEIPALTGVAKPKAGGASGVTPPPSPSASASGSTTKFTDNGRTYNIPNDQVSEFKKDHPNAR